MVAVLSTSCIGVRTRHFDVSFGVGVYVRLLQRPSWQLVLYNDWPVAGESFCGGDERCTLEFLRDEVSIDWLGSNPISDFDHFFDDSQQRDLEDALNQVRGTNPHKCLMMHRNTNLFGDRHNWTSADAGGKCDLGEFIEP